MHCLVIQVRPLSDSENEGTGRQGFPVASRNNHGHIGSVVNMSHEEG
jgi:hypothetical protein